MRILLDACVPKGLGKSLSGHDIRHATEMGWGDLDNGELLDAMTGLFDVLVTVDRGIPHQQQIHNRLVGVAILCAKTNRLSDLLPLVPSLLTAIPVIEPGTMREIVIGL